jgi:nucleoid-associated protein YgaU
LVGRSSAEACSSQAIWDNDHRLRQDAIVHLRQYNPEDRLNVRNRGQVRANPKPYVVKRGDTFKSISQSQYGTPDKWRLIMNANDVRDPTAIKKLVGKQIRIP